MTSTHGAPARAPFGTMPDGRPVERLTLRNRNGIELSAISLGGVITSLRLPDRDGHLEDVVLGFDALEDYLYRSPYFGAIVGRYANRIARGRFTLDGTTYQLAINNGPNHLHGGPRGFDKAWWTAERGSDGAGQGVRFTHTSLDGDQGYPGTFRASVTYTLTDANELVIDYEATTDRPTIVNLSQHSYFNLAGAGTGDILGHELAIEADQFTPVDATLIPTGELAPVAGTPFDFRRPTVIGSQIGRASEQLTAGGGFDHNFVLRGAAGTLRPAARLRDPGSGRVLEIRTTEPGLQFYSGNFLDGTLTGKGGHVYGHRTGLCLETQHFPDSPNEPRWPSTVLRPGETFRSRTVWAFGVEG